MSTENNTCDDVNRSNFWDDDNVIDFVNWYIKLHKLDFRYTLENKTIVESFKNGDDASKWHLYSKLRISSRKKNL